MKLKLKIYLTTTILLVLVLSFLGIIIYTTQKKAILQDMDENMVSHLEDLYTLFDDHVQLKQEKVKISLTLAENIIQNEGDIKETRSKISIVGKDQFSQVEKTYEVPVWELNGEPLHNNFKIVDLIKEKSVETATIFQKIEDGYIRISSNVLTKDGQKAVGTYIPNSSEVVQTIEKGETFYGRAFVVDDWYITAYKPIRIDGIIKGILYVGLKEKNYEFLKQVFSTKKYYSKGYPFLIDKTGKLIIHPTLENQNISQSDLFKRLTAASETEFKFKYKWPENEDGEWKYQYFKYFKLYDCYISATLFSEDIDSKLNRLLLIVVLGFVIAIVILYFGLNSLLQPIINKILEGTSFTQKIADGDLTVRMNTNRKDEIGTLIIALQKMQDKLREMVKDISIGAENIMSASQQLNSNSEILSQGASEQASSVEEISSTLEEFYSSILQNSDNSRQTETIALKALSGIKESNHSSNSTVKSMNEIATKISVISDIAFQTNILALNAAVEAARAGEQGRGFAVVAAEVRKLAERSKVSAEDIINLTKTGVNLSEKTGAQLNNLLPEIEKTSKLVEEITAVSLEMNSGSAQINNSIQQLNQIAQQNASAAEENASSANELTIQAELLQKSVSYFKL